MVVYKYIFILIFFLITQIVNIAYSIEKSDIYSYSIQVLDYQNNNKPLLEKNSKMLLHPASVQKIFTAYMALKFLGSDYRFCNSLYYSGKITKGKILKGDLYIYFGGNPDFTDLDILDLMKRIKNLGIEKIEGNIIIDHTEFDGKLYPRGWDIENQLFCYSAPLSPIIINKNCFFAEVYEKDLEIKLKYDEKINPKIHNEAKIIRDQKCFLDLFSDDSNKYNLIGCVNDKEELPNRLSIAIRNPKIFLEHIINYYAQDQNLKFNKIEYKKLKNNAKFVYDYKSRSVLDLLPILLKNSNNLISELIIKKLGYLQSKKPGNYRDSTDLYENYIRDNLNLEDNSFDIVDASGLSQKNLISSEIINKFLLYIYEGDEEIKKHILNSLSKIKVESVLDGDNKSIKLCSECEILAKTGTLDNTSSLAGYIFKKNKLRYVFSIIINNSLEDKKQREAEIYKILAEALESML